MRTNKLSHKNYTVFENVYQLKLPLNIEYIIPKMNKAKRGNIAQISAKKRRCSTMRKVTEGAFGEVKENMDFRRFLCRGKQNVLEENILLGLAYNVNKLHNKIQGGRCRSYLYPLKIA